MTLTPLPRHGVAFALNPIEYLIVSEAPDDVDHFEIDLYYEPEWMSGDYSIIHTWVEDYMIDDDGNKYARIDISELLLSRVKPMTIPNADNFDVLAPVKRFSIFVQSIAADGTDAEDMETDEDRYVVYGGIQQQKWNNYSEHYFNQHDTNRPLATWAPDNLKVLRTQPYFLYFLCSEDNTLITFKRKKYTTPASSTTETLGTHSNVEKYELLGPVQFILDDDDYIKYDVWVEGSSPSWTGEMKTFVVDFIQHRNVKYFGFNNSVGGFDTIYCSGTYIEEYEYAGDTQTVMAVQILNNTQTPRSRQTIYTEEQGELTASTGFKTRAEIDWFREALLATEFWEYTDDGWMPCEIVRDTVRLLDSEQKLFALQFKYRYAFKNRAFTPRSWSKEEAS